MNQSVSGPMGSGLRFHRSVVLFILFPLLSFCGFLARLIHQPRVGFLPFVPSSKSQVHGLSVGSLFSIQDCWSLFGTFILVLLTAAVEIRLEPHIPGTHFCQTLSRPQGHSAARRIMSMKIPMTPWGIEPATFCLRHRVPQSHYNAVHKNKNLLCNANIESSRLSSGLVITGIKGDV